MASTKNIGLQKFDSSDYVDVAAINSNYDKIDSQLGVDHVIEAGSSGDWRWRKWSSGYMEQWVADRAFPTQSFIDWGSSGLKRSNGSMSFGNYPIAFKARPLCFVTFNSSTQTGFQLMVGYAQTTSTTATQPFFAIDPAINVSNLPTPHFGFYARGFWK